MFFQNIVGSILFISLVNGYPSDITNDKCVNYCSNDAICLIEVNGPKCYCLPPWEGDLCESVRQPETNQRLSKTKQISRSNLRNTLCSYVPNLCKNGGVCFVDNSTIACKCSEDYDGLYCEEESVCKNYCLNGGICTASGKAPNTAANCTCQSGYMGTRCQAIEITTTANPPNTTTDAICGMLGPGFCNTGSCFISGDLALCKCPPTHTGEHCEKLIGGSQPTTNQGQQTPPPGVLTTANSGGVSGITCANNPCQKGRPCYNNGNTYFCYCGDQYTGTNCETNKG